MEFKKCSRCGNFFVSEGMVCPKCTPKDNFEFSTFQSYITQNGSNESVDAISDATGISAKNINRFIEYNRNDNNVVNEASNNNTNSDITFLI